jgi:hypothetical protein
MRTCLSGAFVIAIGLLAGCGGHGPSAPSSLIPPTPSGPGTSTTQSIVGAAVSQAAMNTAVTVSPDGSSRTITSPCADGGSMSVIQTSAGAATSGTFTTSSRLEFTECRVQTVTMNGEPAILLDGTYTIERTTSGALSSVSGTTRMTGGLRFDAGSSSGRARYDCTMRISMQIGSDGTPMPPTFTSSGTYTWEQPLGTVTVHSCGA